MKNRRKTLLLSIIALCICTMLIVGGTFALFTDEVRTNVHLSAGNLEVGLYRISYQDYVLTENGLMAEGTENKTRVDLTKDNSVLFSAYKAVPTSWYKATIEVSNLGSTAFDYGMRIIWNEDNTATNAEKLFAGQIKITVTSEKLSAPVEFMLDECSTNSVSLGHLLKCDENGNAVVETFTVKAEFVDDIGYNAELDNPDEHINNNLAMDVPLDFDVQVFAVQKTSLD